MLKYFISYEDLLENNKLNRNIDFNSKELYILRKNDNKIRIEPLYLFSEFKNSFDKLIQKDNIVKKRILLVELTEEEKDLFDSILIKTYKKNNDGSYEKIFSQNNIVSLINYNVVKRMRTDEYEKGDIVRLVPCVSNSENMYISLDNDDDKNKRFKLNNLNIGCDLYFYTTDEELLERYKESVTKIKEKDFQTYELLEHKVFVIDSLSQDRMIDWTYQTFNLMDNMCVNSIPVNINENNDNYSLNIHDLDVNERKGYIITRDINTFLYDNSIYPIIKYINVYFLENGSYKKMSLYDYLEENNILRYIKKPA